MLALLTKYLLKYHTLSVPHVGTFKLVHQSSEYDVTDKLILPPSFGLQWHRDDAALGDHQLAYLSALVHADRKRIQEELETFGEKFKNSIQERPFTWNGLGVLSKEELKAEFFTPEGLQAIPAHRLVRANSSHSLLVGDKQVSSVQMAKQLQKRRNMSYPVLIGWIVLALLLFTIGFLLYQNGFNPLTSGLK